MLAVSRRVPGRSPLACPALLGLGEQAGQGLDGAFFLLGGHRDMGGREEPDLAGRVAPL